METALLITAFATLFVVIDPIGLTPLFVALTQDVGTRARRAIAFRSVAISFAVLALFAGFGEAVLGFIGIPMPAFRIAGGILLLLRALDMLSERRSKRREGQADEEDGPDPSVFPIAIPLTAGPEALATVILLAGQMPGLPGWITVLAVIASVLAIVLALFLMAGPIERGLGKTGINIVTRLLGMLLAALAVQFILDGLSGFGIGG